jgi:hypothetical protein
MQLYNSSSFLDDLLLAAAWLGAASGSPAYTSQAEAYWARIWGDSNGTAWQSLVANWDNSWWAGNLLLAQATGNATYQAMPLLFFPSPAVRSGMPRYLHDQ